LIGRGRLRDGGSDDSRGKAAHKSE
jgi:hypothetical protein